MANTQHSGLSSVIPNIPDRRRARARRWFLLESLQSLQRAVAEALRAGVMAPFVGAGLKVKEGVVVSHWFKSFSDFSIFNCEFIMIVKMINYPNYVLYGKQQANEEKNIRFSENKKTNS